MGILPAHQQGTPDARKKFPRDIPRVDGSIVGNESDFVARKRALFEENLAARDRERDRDFSKQIGEVPRGSPLAEMCAEESNRCFRSV